MMTNATIEYLYSNYRNMVRGLLLKIIPSLETDWDTMAELEQDVWLRVTERRDKFNGELAQAQTFLYMNTETVAKDWLKAKEREVETVNASALDYEDEEGNIVNWLEENAVEGEHPEALAIAEEEYEIGMDGLSEREVEVFNCMYVDGMSAAETAEALGVSTNTIGPLLTRLRGKLL